MPTLCYMWVAVSWIIVNGQLSHSLTYGTILLQMTPGELKFALALETKLNSLPDPEYRQLVVEALMIFSLVTKSSDPQLLENRPLLVESVINTAQSLFLEDQVRQYWLERGSGKRRQ